MRRRERDDDVVEVELVEHDEPFGVLRLDGATAAGTESTGAEREPSSGGVPGPHGPRDRRTLWWVGAGVLVLLVGAGVVANVVAAREEAERREALAGLTWVLPDLSGGLDEAWRVEAGWVEGESESAIYVSGATTFGGGFAALDPQTGNRLWEAPVGDSGYCYLPWTWGSYGYIAGSPAPAPDVVLCDVYSGSGGEVPGTTTISVDAHTGERLAQLTGEGTPLLGSFAVDDDYVTVTSSADGAVVAIRQELRTGAVVWEYRSEPGLAEDLVGEGGGWGVRMTGDRVVIDGSRPLALALDTGEVTEDVPDAEDDEFVVALADGSTVELRLTPAGSDISGTVLDPDGSERFDFAGYPWVAQYGDGSSAGVLVVQEISGPIPGAVVALDLDTGEEVWRNADLADSGGAALMLGDVALVVKPDGVVAIDLPTGRELWSQTGMFGYAYPSFASDGRLVVTWVHDEEGSRFVALDLRTGEERWSEPAPDGVTQLRPTRAGLLLAMTDREVIAFRP